MILVYAFPPVGLLGAEWTIDAPVSVSRSLLTGRRYVSATQRRRRMARLEVSALANGRKGAGYMEALKRLLDGGVNLVRLTAAPINWHLDDDGLAHLHNAPVSWTNGGAAAEWTSQGVNTVWFLNDVLVRAETPRILTGVYQVKLTGLFPPGATIGAPGDFISVTPDAGGAPVTAMLLRPMTVSSTGEAWASLTQPLPAGSATVGAVDTGVFEAVELPRAMQPIGEDWSYEWEFREVFADEVPDGWTEVDPW